MFCDQCGKEIEKTSKFCDHCGYSFNKQNTKNELGQSQTSIISILEKISNVNVSRLLNRSFLISSGIIAAIAIASGAVYSLYQGYQDQLTTSSQELSKLGQQLQEAQESTDKSLASLKEENEDLKSESEQLKTSLQTVSSNSQKQQLSSTNELSQNLLNKIMPRIVKVRCVKGNSVSTGSGTIQALAGGSTQWSVYTNLHVTDLNWSCTVSLPTGVDYVPTKTYSASLVGEGSYSYYPDIDFAILRVSNTTESFNEFPLPACGVADVQIGNRVTIFGYPGFGGNSLTVTDGIVSGIEYTAYGPVYKTSAKIDSGNSGGLAIDNNNKCGIGIPTWAVSGTLEGLGYIQSWDMIIKSGNL